MQLFSRVCLATALVAAFLTSTSFAQPPGGRPGGFDNPGQGGPGGPDGRGPGGRGPDGRGPGGPGGRGPGGPGGPEGFMRMLPVMAALDANQDGKISADEISNATQALKSLDKNNDGDLTFEELRPDFSAMRRPGGPDGQGGPGRPGGAPDQAGPNGPPAGRGGPDPEQLVTRLMQFDKNGDGKLTKDELSERQQGLLARADTDEDGAASREELMKMAATMGRGRGGQRGDGEGRPPQARRGGGPPQGGAPGGERPRRPQVEDDAE